MKIIIIFLWSHNSNWFIYFDVGISSSQPTQQLFKKNLSICLMSVCPERWKIRFRWCKIRKFQTGDDDFFANWQWRCSDWSHFKNPDLLSTYYLPFRKNSACAWHLIFHLIIWKCLKNNFTLRSQVSKWSKKPFWRYNNIF